MTNPMSKNESELRSQYDFSKAVRGKFHERYKSGSKVTLLEGEPDSEDSANAEKPDSQLVEIAAKHLLISRLVAAGFEVAEPLRDNGIDLIVYRGGSGFKAWPIQMKASTQESFSLHRKYEKTPDLLIAYVWNVNAAEKGEVFLLTFKDAVKVMELKPYAKTDSWIKNDYYFVRNAGSELKGLLKKFGMTAEQWREKLQAAG
jgi:hypothetical protein